MQSLKCWSVLHAQCIIASPELCARRRGLLRFLKGLRRQILLAARCSVASLQLIHGTEAEPSWQSMNHQSLMPATWIIAPPERHAGLQGSADLPAGSEAAVFAAREVQRSLERRWQSRTADDLLQRCFLDLDADFR